MKKQTAGKAYNALCPLFSFVLLAASWQTGFAQTAAHWAADSTTAMAITGDIDLAPAKITFGNGDSFLLTYIGTSRGVTLLDENPPARMFRIRNPHMFRNRTNTLCGKALATYLSIYTGASPYGPNPILSLTLFSGRIPPNKLDLHTTTSLCGNFNFSQN